MKSVTHLFADLTASLEDLHAIAVEGQCADTPPDVYAVLAAMIDTGACDVRRIVAEVRAALDGR
jgi:hypothetical protein